MTNRRGAPDAGFTLVELLVALTVVGLVTSYALQSLSTSLTQLARSRDAAAAMLVAQSTLARIGQDIPFGKEAEGVAGGYSWDVQSAPFTAIPVPAETGVAGYTVQVMVGWRERGRARRVGIATVRLAYRKLGS